MCATEPIGPIRDRLETERANLVIGLFVARVAAMRLSSGEQARGCFSQFELADRPPRLTVRGHYYSRCVRFHSLTSGPSSPRTGSVFGSFTSGIVFSAFAWFSGVGRVICICGPGG